MDDPRDEQRRDFERSLGEGQAIGAGADGKVESFPLEELGARVAARDMEEAATDHAAFPEDDADEVGDVGDLDELGDLLAE